MSEAFPSQPQPAASNRYPHGFILSETIANQSGYISETVKVEQLGEATDFTPTTLMAPPQEDASLQIRQNLFGVVKAADALYGIVRVQARAAATGKEVDDYVLTRFSAQKDQPAAIVGTLLEPLMVGRKHQKDVSTFVSREHFKIRLHDGRIIIGDQNSTHKTGLITATTEFQPQVGNPLVETPSLWAAAHKDAKLAVFANYHGQDIKQELVDLGIEADRPPTLQDVGEASEALKGEDTILNSPENRLFGVFDGVGSEKNGGLASGLAAKQTAYTFGMARDQLVSHPEAGAEDVKELLKNSLYDAQKVVRLEYGDTGATTATVAAIYAKDDRNYAIWASVGDSRLYVYNRSDNTLRQITVDETEPGKPDVINNAIGDDRMVVRQSGVLELFDGDELMLCSDGLTGDKGTDVMQDYEIMDAMMQASSAQESAANLLAIARKKDDRSILVVA